MLGGTADTVTVSGVQSIEEAIIQVALPEEPGRRALRQQEVWRSWSC